MSPRCSAQLRPLRGGPEGRAGQTAAGVCAHKQAPVSSAAANAIQVTSLPVTSQEFELEKPVSVSSFLFLVPVG